MKYTVKRSSIHGNGVFARDDYEEGTDLGVSIPLISEKENQRVYQRNTFGLLVNDSKTPNAICQKIGKDWHFVGITKISKGQEIFVNYKQYQAAIDLECLISGKAVSVI